MAAVLPDPMPPCELDWSAGFKAGYVQATEAASLIINHMQREIDRLHAQSAGQSDAQQSKDR